MQRGRAALTLVEVLIVVVILLIIGMMVVPGLDLASNEARDSALLTDIRTARNQIRLYTTQHAGRPPHLDENGQADTANFANRLTQRTDVDGKLDPNGLFGPYLVEWPENPFCTDSVAPKIKFGTEASPPRDGTTGWYYNTNTCILSANSTQGGESMDP